LLGPAPYYGRTEGVGGGTLGRFALGRQRRVLVRNAGWNFTYMGGADAVVYKHQNFAHAESDDPHQPRVTRHPKAIADHPANAAACRVYGRVCPCGCTWGDLPQAYVDPAEFSVPEMDLPACISSQPDAYRHWVRPARDEAPVVRLPTRREVDVMVLRDDASTDWLLTQTGSRALPEHLCVLDVRPGRRALQQGQRIAGSTWLTFPSAAPAFALNRALDACGALTVRRWFPGVSAPLSPLSIAEIRALGGYDEALPAGEEWALRWRLARSRGAALTPRQGIVFFEPASLGGPLWQSHLYVSWVMTSGKRAGMPARGLVAWSWRFWRAKELLSARHWRTAWREIAAGDAWG